MPDQFLVHWLEEGPGVGVPHQLCHHLLCCLHGGEGELGEVPLLNKQALSHYFMAFSFDSQNYN